MEINTRFPAKLDAITDAPEPFRSALKKRLGSDKRIRLLVHAPSCSTGKEKFPATLLAVTDKGWLVASDCQQNGTSVSASIFSETLFLELTSILLFGQFKSYFAMFGTSFCATANYNTVGEQYYREAIQLILNGIDGVDNIETKKNREATELFDDWPFRFRMEAERYWPRGQRLLAAVQWPAVVGGFRRELSAAGALLVTEREVVVISEEKHSPRRLSGDAHEFGGIITYFPFTRLADFKISTQEYFSVLALEVRAAHGGETLEILFPSGFESHVAEAMESILIFAALCH
jgi:hypothetical protein